MKKPVPLLLMSGDADSLAAAAAAAAAAAGGWLVGGEPGIGERATWPGDSHLEQLPWTPSITNPTSQGDIRLRKVLPLMLVWSRKVTG